MAGANRIHWPRRGSLQFWPRVRAKRQYPRVKSWVFSKNLKLSGFLGFKAGMTHILFRDTRSVSPTKGMEVFMPVTIVECPPMKVKAIRGYIITPYGLKLAYDSAAKKQAAPEKYEENIIR